VPKGSKVPRIQKKERRWGKENHLKRKWGEIGNWAFVLGGQNKERALGGEQSSISSKEKLAEFAFSGSQTGGLGNLT